MHRLLPPLCLLMAIAMVIAGFALWSVDPPEATADLAQARAANDEQSYKAIESRVLQKRFTRNLLLTSLFVGAVAMAVTAFWTMRPAEADPPR